MNSIFPFLTTDANVRYFPPSAYQMMERGSRLSQILILPRPGYFLQGYDENKTCLVKAPIHFRSTNKPDINSLSDSRGGYRS
jgi:hypothetical protein